MKKQKIRKKPVYDEVLYHPEEASTTEIGRLHYSKRELTMFSDGFRQALEYKVDSETIKNFVELCNTIPFMTSFFAIPANLVESLDYCLRYNLKQTNLHVIRTLINESDLFVILFAHTLFFDGYDSNESLLRINTRKGLIYKFAYILNKRIQKDIYRLLSHPILIEDSSIFYDFRDYLKFFRLDKDCKETLNKIHKLIQYNI